MFGVNRWCVEFTRSHRWAVLSLHHSGGASSMANLPSADKKQQSYTSSVQLDNYPFFLLCGASEYYVLKMERALKATGIDLPGWRTLMLLAEKNPRSITEIAGLAIIKVPTMMKALERMKKLRLVTTAQARDDGRVTEVHITKKGRESADHVRRVAKQICSQALLGFTPRDVHALNRAMVRIRAICRMTGPKPAEIPVGIPPLSGPIVDFANR